MTAGAAEGRRRRRRTSGGGYNRRVEIKTHDIRHRVRYAETDQMGVVYYANYLVWMEMGRAEYCRALGVSYRDMEKEDGVLLAVAEATCRYLAPAYYDEEVTIRTWLERAHPRMVQFGYQVLNAADQRTIAEGYTKHIVCDRELKPSKLPAKYRALFGIPVEQVLNASSTVSCK
jgi:acyl-CoA thioester hydrolase